MNILLVDDDANSRASLARFIKLQGYTIDECQDGEEALRQMNQKRYHLVLSDVKMPRMDGLQLLNRIKQSKQFRDTVVVLITGYGDIKSAVTAIKEGAYDYVSKPVQIEELSAILERISEYLTLKIEHSELKEHFDRQVQEATNDIKKELDDIKKAYAKEVGTAHIGIYSSTLRQVFELAEKLHSNPDIPVLIEGETGTGKEVVARYIHYGYGDTTASFVALNCAAISPQLFESELFGYEGGAFTGGSPKGQKGKIELAHGGSIFLDEITQLSTDYQAKLLRVIQEKEYYRVGGIKKMEANVRFICSTNQNVVKSVTDGTIRKDLYYRLNVGYISVPPLRERQEEIIPLTKIFLEQLSEQKKSRYADITPEAQKILLDYSWPGNIRELKSVIERIVLLWDDTAVRPTHLEFLTSPDHSIHLQQAIYPTLSTADIPLPEQGFNLDEWILTTVKKALDKHNGNRTAAAQYLGISRSVLYTYLKNIK